MTDFICQYRIIAKDESQMKTIACTLASQLPTKALIFLDADLGMGKSYLTREVIRSFGYSGAIKSPTYTLVEPYTGQKRDVLHFDLYRLAEPEELEFIGIWDYLNQDAISFIEWPNKAQGVLPKPDLLINIDDYEQGRELILSGFNDGMQQSLEQMHQLLSKGNSEIYVQRV